MTTVHTQGPPPAWYPDPNGAPGVRWWNGTEWTNDVPILSNTDPAPYPDDPPDDDPAIAILNDTERAALLDALVAHATPRGWRVESRSLTQAVLVHGSNASGGVHVIHFLMTIFTFGLWALVWILYTMSRHEERYTFTIDPYGQITES